MNHILKDAEANQTKNLLTYRLPDLPLNTELAKVVSDFILKK
jgi:hypothetical protein